MAYDKSGPFTNGSGPGINQGFLNALEDYLFQAELAPLRVARSGKDAEGVWTQVSWYRADGTLARTSVLSGGTSPEYTTRTVTDYENDGATVRASRAFTLSYDLDGDFEAEVFA